MMKVSLVALEGGPGGGKTTALVRFADAILAAGMYPLIIPEIPTLLICGGVNPKNVGQAEFQRSVVALQLALERRWEKHAEKIAEETGKRVVILCDRGLMGPIAYIDDDPCPFEYFEALLREAGISSLEEGLLRYTAVVHLVTAADGAPDCYTLVNNTARSETIEQAIVRDRKTKAGWLAHPHLLEIANRTPDGKRVNFQDKMENGIRALFHVLGEPESIEIEDKFLLNSFDSRALPVPFEVVDIEQVYLSSGTPNVSERVRKRSWRNGVSYTHGTKEHHISGGRIEQESFISHHEYMLLLSRADPKREPLLKKRYLFLWESQRFEVDVFVNREGIYMEREKTHISDVTVLPPFIEVGRDVTTEKGHSNRFLALKGTK